MPALRHRPLDRVEHGAQIDCSLLAAVYLELLGGVSLGLILSPRRRLQSKWRNRKDAAAARASAEELARSSGDAEDDYGAALAGQKAERLREDRTGPGRAQILGIGLLTAQ